jgi:hypothetical protein
MPTIYNETVDYLSTTPLYQRQGQPLARSAATMYLDAFRTGLQHLAELNEEPYACALDEEVSVESFDDQMEALSDQMVDILTQAWRLKDRLDASTVRLAKEACVLIPAYICKDNA